MTETQPEAVETDTVDKFRFGVCSADGFRSSTWTAFSQNDDFYLGVRNKTGAIKASLHSEEYCQYAFTKEYHAKLRQQGASIPDDRAVVRWHRRPAPERGAVHVASVLFPTDYLRLRSTPETVGKAAFFFPPAPLGHAVEFGFFYSKERPPTLGRQLENVGLPIVSTELSNGEIVSIVMRQVPFDDTRLPALNAIGPSLKPLSPEELPLPWEQKRDLSMTLIAKPQDGEALQMVEITGLTLRRSH